MQHVLVAGGAGFLGSHLCERFLDEGFKVTALDSFLTGCRENVAHLSDNEFFTLIEADVSNPFTINSPVHYILHFASPASPIDYKDWPLETLRAGSFATHSLLDLAHAHKARFLMASTSEVYGDPAPEFHPQPETYWGNVNSVGTRSCYDEAKRYAEAATMSYRRALGVDTRIVRIFNTYGPRMRPHDGRVVTNFIRQALKGEPITLYGDGLQTRSFCYVDDLIEGIYRLLMSSEPDPVNIGNPGEFTVRELAEMVREMTGSASEIVMQPLLFPDDPKQRKPDIAKARTILGWEPRVPLREGLAKTIEYMRGVV